MAKTTSGPSCVAAGRSARTPAPPNRSRSVAAASHRKRHRRSAGRAGRPPARWRTRRRQAAATRLSGSRAAPGAGRTCRSPAGSAARCRPGGPGSMPSPVSTRRQTAPATPQPPRRRQHVLVGHALEQRQRRQPSAQLRPEMVERVLHAGAQRLPAGPRRPRTPAAALRPRRAAPTAAPPGRPLQVRQDQPHAQRMAVQPRQQLGIGPLLPALLRPRVRRQHVVGQFRRLLRRQAAELQPADRPSQSSSLRLVMISRLQPSAATSARNAAHRPALRRVERRRRLAGSAML